MSIEVRDLVKYYGDREVLKKINFSIPSGGIVGFLGPNGAGKSTTMKILAGAISLSGGKVEVEGLNVTTCTREIQKRIGYLPENNPLYPDMYVREYLKLIASVFKVSNSQKAINTVIEQTGLGEERGKLIGQLSKGYRQRVGLAQSLLHNPDVLILDEPTTGLDPNQILEIRALIKDVGREKTVILSSHIMQEVEAICDRVLIISKGEIVADDSTDLLKRKNSGNIVEVEFLESLEIEAFSGATFINKTEKLTENLFLVRGENEDIRPILFKWAVESGYTIIGLQVRKQHLEDVFRQLTIN